MKNTEVWIGRFDVKPRPGNETLGVAKGAFVNVVALARDKGSYVELVEATMREYEFDIVHYNDVARLSEWTKDNRPHGELVRLAAGLTAAYPIQFDEFQAYASDDA